MKNFFKKAAKLTGIAVTLSLVIIAGIYFFESRTSAGSVGFKAVTEEVAYTTEAVQEKEAVKTTEAPKATEAATEEATEAPTEAVTEAPTEAVVEAAPQAQPVVTETAAPVVAQPATVEATQAASSTYTNVTYSDVNGNKSTFATLDEAKAAVNVPALSDSEAHNQAVANKSTYADYASTLLTLINNYRAANGLAALDYNDNLATAAMHRAAESAYSNWNVTAYENGSTKRHIRPNWQKASTIANYYGIAGNFGENYGRFFNTPADILGGWQASSAHNALLLSGSYSQIGIGVAQASNGDFYWVALFN